VCATSDVGPRVKAHAWQAGGGQHVARAHHSAFDSGDHALGLGCVTVRHQPAGTLWQPHPHEEDHQRQGRAEQKRQPPAVFRIDQDRIEQQDGAQCAHGRADPEAAVDDEIGPSANSGGDELLDGRVDRGIFPADARAGEKAEQREAREIPRKGGGRGRKKVHRERDEEQLLASEPIGQPAEEQRADHGASKIGAGGETDIGIAELKDWARLQCACDRAGERHFEPVEYPGDAERYDHKSMESAPGQAIEPRGDIGIDGGGRRLLALSICVCQELHPHRSRSS